MWSPGSLLRSGTLGSVTDDGVEENHKKGNDHMRGHTEVEQVTEEKGKTKIEESEVGCKHSKCDTWVGGSCHHGNRYRNNLPNGCS